MILNNDRWLEGILKRNVFRLDFINAPLLNISEDELRNLRAAMSKKPVFIYTKISPGDIETIKFLHKEGFYLVDTNILLEKPVDKRKKCNEEHIIRYADRADREGTVLVAANSFDFSRFHLDISFTRKEADLIKAEWADNYFKGNRGDYMIVAEVPGKITAFLQLIGKNDQLIIDLIAVDRLYRRQGVAQELIRFAESSCQGFNKVFVGTQIANIPSIRCYQNIGFNVCSAQYVFHFHNNDAI